MAIKSFKPSHIELRNKTYFALLYVPKDVRHIIRKIKFYKSIQTGILREGEAIASVWVINWKYQIKTASLSLQETSENSDTVSANQVFGKQSFEDNSIFV